MASKSKSLGIAADIFSESIEGVIRKIPVTEIIPDKNQPRNNKNINVEALANSLQEEGLLQPILVNKEGNKYSIIAGERRYRAALSLKWKDIECKIVNKTGKDKYRLAVIENLQRENLDPIEEALALARLKNDFSYTDNDLSYIIGKSRNYISEILSIAEIPPNWLQKAHDASILSKNLLVQFAQAVKLEIAGEFIQDFSEGRITTVKTAKNFIQTAKGNTPPKTENIPTTMEAHAHNPSHTLSTSIESNSSSLDSSEKKLTKDSHEKIEKETNIEKMIFPPSDISIQTKAEWVAEDQIYLQVRITHLKNASFSIDSLENHIHESLSHYFLLNT